MGNRWVAGRVSGVLRVATVGHWPDHLRDDFTSTFDLHDVAFAKILAADEIEVVQWLACVTVVPPISTGSSTAYGLTDPVRPTFTAIFVNFVSWRCRARIFARSRSAVHDRRSRRGSGHRPSASTFTTPPSIPKSSLARTVVLDLVRPRRARRRWSRQRRRCGAVGMPQLSSRSSNSDCREIGGVVSPGNTGSE